jgi:hypothetical protein
MDEITGFDEQVNGFFDFLKTPKIKIPQVRAKSNVNNINLILTPQEKAIILAMRAKRKGTYFKK